ncbi:MAG: hypothetical protein QM529_07190 [Hydrotalea sp.]|nr:hypothetical protein [Hydrotalea sp.]
MHNIINLFPDASHERQFFMPEPWLGLKEEILAMTLFGGGFPCNIILLETIALSVMTRVRLAENSAKLRQLFGDDVVAVCLKKNQYQAWQEFGRTMGHFYRASQQRKDFQICRRVARRAVKNVITLSPTIKFFVDGSRDVLGDVGDDARLNPTHFHHAEDHPDWAVGQTPLFLLGDYFFYNMVG